MFCQEIVSVDHTAGCLDFSSSPVADDAYFPSCQSEVWRGRKQLDPRFLIHGPGKGCKLHILRLAYLNASICWKTAYCTPMVHCCTGNLIRYSETRGAAGHCFGGPQRSDTLSLSVFCLWDCRCLEVADRQSSRSPFQRPPEAAVFCR